MNPLWRKRIMRRTTSLGVLSALGLCLPFVMGNFSHIYNELTWILDAAVHWQWLYLVGLLLFGGISAVLDRRWAALLMFAPLPWLSASPQLEADQGNAKAFNLLGANVNLHNPDASPLRRLIARSAPDVVALVEITPEYAAQLENQLPGYPHRKVVPQDSPFGIALYSRHPFGKVEVVEHEGIPQIQATLEWNGDELELVVVHPMPPLSSAYHQQRDQAMAVLAGKLARSDRPALVIGDLNGSPWSSLFAGFADTGLYRATGLEPSWPALGQGVLGIPIDQVLANSRWRRLASGTGPDIGSDHLPIQASLALVGN